MTLLHPIPAAAVAIVALAQPPVLPPTPAPIDALVYARAFTLDEAYEHSWRAERPAVTSGYLLVLRVDPDLIYPRQTAEPVLYVGAQTAQRLNVGYTSGHVVAIVPGAVEGEGAIDLARTAIWFGTPELPERVDRARVEAELRRAVAAGIAPVGVDAARAATAPEGVLHARDLSAMLVQAADLISRYAPDERDRADALRGRPSTPLPRG